MRATVLLLLCSSLGSAGALADGCEGFKWDLTPEWTLYAAAPTAARAGTSADKLPDLKTGTLYALTLAPLAEVKYALAPGKPMSPDGAFGGVVRFSVPASGDYRVGLDGPFWIDVVAGVQAVQSNDFGGPHGCAKPPHKLVQFTLKRNTPYLLQLSGHTADVRVTIVQSVPGKS